MMHPAVEEYVTRILRTLGPDPAAGGLTILDIGGRDVNGTLRHLFTGQSVSYRVLDALPGVNVDIVANAAGWVPDQAYDLVLCTEVFEHTPDWPEIVKTAGLALRPGGRLIITCAGPGRAPHSAIEATALQPGEYYENVSRPDLTMALRAAGMDDVHVDRVGLDLQATGVRG